MSQVVRVGRCYIRGATGFRTLRVADKRPPLWMTATIRIAGAGLSRKGVAGMTRRDRIIRLAKLRGDKAALAIMGDNDRAVARIKYSDREFARDMAIRLFPNLGWTEAELRAMWGDR